jgi:hypothetical protein
LSDVDTGRDERGRCTRLPEAMRAKMWPKGYAPNPTGRGGEYLRCLMLCRKSSYDAALEIIRLSQESDDERVRFMSATWVYERAWGKAKEFDPNAERPAATFNPRDYSPEELAQIEIVLLLIKSRQAEWINEWPARRGLGVDHIEVDGSRKNAANTRGRPFAKGNPGRPKGARGRTTLAAQMLLDGEAEALTRKAIDLALAGDTVALKLCMDCILPPRKEWPVEFTMPPLQTGADTTAAMMAIIQAASEGKILLTQAVEFAKLL